jgi:hypothetical protein
METVSHWLEKKKIGIEIVSMLGNSAPLGLRHRDGFI